MQKSDEPGEGHRIFEILCDKSVHRIYVGDAGDLSVPFHSLNGRAVTGEEHRSVEVENESGKRFFLVHRHRLVSSVPVFYQFQLLGK